MRKILLIVGLLLPFVLQGQLSVGTLSHQKQSSSLLNGLVSYWTLDETTGNALDETGTTTLTRGVSVTQNASGKIGTSYSFAASTDATGLLTTASTIYKFTTAFAISLWLNTSEQAYRSFIGHYYDDPNETGYDMEIDDGGILYFSVRDGTTSPYASSNADVATGSWVHIVTQWNGSYVQLYINGTLQTTSTARSTAPSYSASSAFCIGAREIGTTGFTGGIDEVGIWNRALTSTEITFIYNSGSGITYPF